MSESHLPPASTASAFTVVYCTHGKDLPWLRLSLESLGRFLTDRPREVHVYHHDACTDALHRMLGQLEVRLTLKCFPVSYRYHGYLTQQVLKLACHRPVDTDWVMLMDCDTLFHQRLGLRDLLSADGRFRWRVVDRAPANADSVRWQLWGEAVERMTGEPMRRFYSANGFPFLFRRDSLREAEAFFERLHGMNYDAYCLDWARRNGATTEAMEAGANVEFRQLVTAFNEFAWYGWYAERHGGGCVFEPTEVMAGGPCAISPWTSSFWSHAGLDEDLARRLLELIRAGDGPALQQSMFAFNTQAPLAQPARASDASPPGPAGLRERARGALGTLSRRLRAALSRPEPL